MHILFAKHNINKCWILFTENYDIIIFIRRCENTDESDIKKCEININGQREIDSNIPNC